jgi:hypothetical protein
MAPCGCSRQRRRLLKAASLPYLKEDTKEICAFAGIETAAANFNEMPQNKSLSPHFLRKEDFP